MYAWPPTVARWGVLSIECSTLEGKDRSITGEENLNKTKELNLTSYTT